MYPRLTQKSHNCVCFTVGFICFEVVLRFPFISLTVGTRKGAGQSAQWGVDLNADDKVLSTSDCDVLIMERVWHCTY